MRPRRRRKARDDRDPRRARRRGARELHARRHRHAPRRSLWNVAGRQRAGARRPRRPGKTIRRPEAARPRSSAASSGRATDGKSLALVASGAAPPARHLGPRRRARRRFAQLTRSPHAGVDLGSAGPPRARPLQGARRPRALRLALPPARRRAARSRPCSRSTAAPRDRSAPASAATTRRCSSRGIAVFAPNVRGSSGFGKRFVNLDNGALRVDGVRGHQGQRRRRRRGRRRRPRSASASWAAPTAATW